MLRTRSIEARSNDEEPIIFLRGAGEMMLRRRNVTSRENVAVACLPHAVVNPLVSKLISLRCFNKIPVTLSSKKIMIKCFCICFKSEKFVVSIVPMPPC